MTTQSAIHHILALLAGDPVAAADAPVDGLARLVARVGRGLTPDSLEGRGRDNQNRPPRFIRLTFPGFAPTDAFIVQVATAAGLRVESLAQGPANAPRWLLIEPQSPPEISAAVARLRATHRIHAVPFRTVED